MNRCVVSLSTLLFLAAGIPASAAMWIEDFTGNPEDFRLERSNQTLPIEIYRRLHSGDRLSVLVDRSGLQLMRDDGSRVEI